MNLAQIEEMSLLNIEGDHKLYILLTDTKTTVAKISKMVTKQPYNHVSVAFDDKLTEVYAYAINTSTNGMRGGLMREGDDLKGASYSLYSISLSQEALDKVKSKVFELSSEVNDTSYNYLGLINAIFRKDIFLVEDSKRMICSQFVVELLRTSGVDLFKNITTSSVVRPYDLVRSKLLKFERRGKIK